MSLKPVSIKEESHINPIKETAPVKKEAPKKINLRKELKLLEDLFGPKQKLSGVIPCFVVSYLSHTETRDLSECLTLAGIRPKQAKLDKEIFSPHIAKDQLGTALEIVKSAQPRHVLSSLGNKYGFTFTPPHELLTYLMQQAKGKIVMEWAGADGPHMRLLGLAGIKKGYLNDLEPLEVNRFKSSCQSLPATVSGKLIPDVGSCLTILERLPRVEGTVDHLLCLNLLHFLTNEELDALAKTLHRTLKPGGQAIFIVNSIYGLDSEKIKDLEAEPNTSTFYQHTSAIQDDRQGKMPCTILTQDFSVCPEKLFKIRTATQTSIYEKNTTTGNKWVPLKEEFEPLPSIVKKSISKTLKDASVKDALKEIPSGSIKVLATFARIFNERNLREFFERQGFDFECSFILDSQSFITHEKNGAQLGIIVRRPLRSSLKG